VKCSVRLLLAISVLALGAAQVRAGDMVFKAPPPVDPPSWTGFYFGGNVGYGFGQKQFYDIYGLHPDYALDADANVQGWIGGFQMGYNYQIKWLVLGVQGGFDWSGVRNSFSCFSFGNQQCSADAEWFATITGRVGGVIGPALLYVDGGPAWTRDTITNIAGTSTCVPAGGVTVCSGAGDLYSGSQIRLGWTVGGGIEYLLSPNWSVFGEYSYMNFGERAITLVDGGTGIFSEAVKQEIQLVKVGFNYRLTNTAGSGPVMSYAPQPHGVLADEESAETIRAFSALDVAKDSADVLFGGLFALSKDIDTSGPRLWITGEAGWYQFPAQGSTIRGISSAGSILGGYAFEGNNYEINLLGGLSAENDILSAYDATDRVQGTAGGVKVRGDAWVNPNPQSLFYGEAEYATAFQTYWTLAKYGFDVTNGKQIFVGPEVVALGDARFNQWRVGASVTQLKFGKVEVDVSAGFAHDSVVGNGAYTHVEVSAQF